MKRRLSSLFATTLGCVFLAAFAAIPRTFATPQDDFLAERESLVQSFLAFRASIQTLPPAARAAALTQWTASQAPQIAALRQSAAQISASAPAPKLPILTEVDIPSNASPTMESFLMASASLQNDRASMANSVRKSTLDVRLAAWQAWRSTHRAALQAQQQLGAQLASATGSPPLPPIPAVPEVPPNATPAMRAFSTARNALLQTYVARMQGILSLPADQQADARAALQADISQQMQTLVAQLPPQ
jgi:hypothetical protein